MNAITVLILFPLISSALIYLVRQENVRDILVRLCAIVTAALSLYVVCRNFKHGLKFSYGQEHIIDIVLMILEILIAIYIISVGLKNRKWIISFLALVQTSLMVWFELTQKSGIEVHNAIILDKLSSIMVLIVGIIGSLICIYAVGYMKSYHIHHSEYKERKSFFFSVLFLFLSAMFGIVLSNNLTVMYFCWELTSLSSFLLIGYTKTAEAKQNSCKALAINLFGGLGFCLAIIILGMKYQTIELSTLVSMEPGAVVLVIAFLLCIAALTKSAQFPFSSWLLGAMVAPTPSSALLHSATMVKAGVYLIIRIAPLLGITIVGRIVTLIGGLTFLLCSFMAIQQSDGKKILAYSTIANLGLIVLCASAGTQESLWAAILLVIFHSVSKSLLFLSVGSIEHQIGSRNVEDMDILLKVSRRLCLYMMIGISGMFLAPFGMLISKWVAMKAFIDSNNFFVVVILAYGSSATLFYWAKWLGKLASNASTKRKEKHKFHLDEEVPIFLQAVLVVISCFSFPLISQQVLIPYLTDVFKVEPIIPIGTSDVTIMLVMLSMLIVLPISFIPLYKNDNRRIVPIYMAGENTGDNTTFYGFAGEKQKVQLRNWYMENYFGKLPLALIGNLIAIGLLCLCIILLIGGLVR